MQKQNETEIDLAPAERLLASVDEADRFDNGRVKAEVLIPLLHGIQKEYGYLPHPVLTWLSKEARIPESRIFGVISFYTQFYLEPQGKHEISCCCGTACHVKGSDKVADAITNEFGIESGETSEDGLFTLHNVNCVGACALAPVLIVDGKYHDGMTADKALKILGKIKSEETAAGGES